MHCSLISTLYYNISIKFICINFSIIIGLQILFYIKNKIINNNLLNCIMNHKKVNLLDMDLDKLSIFFNKIGEKSFRAKQVMHWIYHEYCDDFNKMINLSKNLRDRLSKIAEIRAPVVHYMQKSSDGTRKWMMQVSNYYIETVYIPDKTRATLCVSSQVGCSLKCTFCATAQQGFSRNLKVSEIVGQVWKVNKSIFFENKNQKCNNFLSVLPITHVVFMGMGEPLLNLTSVVFAIKIMLSRFGFALSKRHITVSTSGIVPGIDKLKNMIDIPLAISLHAPNDFIRNKIMPINHKYNISCLFQSIRRYLDRKTINRKRVTIEYVLLNHVNSEIQHAHELARNLIKIPCKVNLISWNSIPNSKYTCVSADKMYIFQKILLDYGIMTTIRAIRGVDINAGCGQLIGKIV